MYQHHFQLNDHPFGLTPDTQFFFDLPAHTEALNVLFIALGNAECFIKITGDVGTGKTMLCRKLLNELPEPFQTAYIPNPLLTPAGLYQAIATEFAIECPLHTDTHRLLQLINTHLINLAQAGKKPVLIIDEAQALSLETLEALRLLTNLETESQKLLQIVLFGQPELDEHLRHQSIRQFQQRISFSYQLKPLTITDTQAYVRHRLSIAGASDGNIFSGPACQALHYYSRGIPRLINMLAHKAMLAAFGSGLDTVGMTQIHAAAMDTEAVRNRWPVINRYQKYALWLLFSLTGFRRPVPVSRL